MKPLLLICLALAALTLRAEDDPGAEALTAAHKVRLAWFDAGPSSIDVSAYPQAAREDYRVFREKCSLCHSPSRPINSDYALPNEWQLYILRMTSKPGSNISPNDSRRIYHFLVYDSSARKSDLLNRKLGQLPPDLRAAMVAKIDAVHAAYRKP